jgi:dipeptidyl aminopeptidase/acylaminoacyl peptidase
VCIAVCGVMMVPAAVATAAFPGANGRIAYSSWDYDACHSSRPDGTRQRRIVRCRHATSVNYSADGRRIVFTRGDAGWIAVARANGRERSWLVRGGFQPASGAWWDVDWAAFSPDGSQVVFSVVEDIPDPHAPDEVRTERNVYVIGVDGANLRLLAREANYPVFSPDGTRIAYVAWHGRTRAVETVAADGTDRRTLVSPNIRAFRLDFAPDGTRLMVLEWIKRRGHVGGWIVIVDAETGERTRLPARVTGTIIDAVWSPDGRRIAFTHFDSKQVFTIRPDGTGKQLAFTARVPGIDRLAWQPRP